jgi:murein DD-endopeptidase MepM/ murein hydrolase activator NlpD
VTVPKAAPKSSPGTSYCWPVTPFDQPHPVRGGFGDPRMVFNDPPVPKTVLTGGGSFQFHFGVDVSAPDGTSAFPVLSGTVTHVEDDWIQVGVDGQRSFQYWHLDAAVKVGQHVDARTTLLGTIKTDAGHVHLSELSNGSYINPLIAGHLTPYADTTAPVVEAISFRATDGSAALPGFLRGQFDMIAEVYDFPSVPVPGPWHGMPVAPALLTWRIVDLDGLAVVPEKTAVDFRTTFPPNNLFWSHYARGTYQNMCVFGPHYSWGQPGCYLFRLTPTPFDTKTIPDGVYDLVVTATDIAGNQGSRSLRLTVHNRPGWVGS